MDFVIREFQEDDVAQLMRLNQALAEVHASTSQATRQQLLDGLLGTRLATCYVADSGGRLVAFAMVHDWINFEYGTRICSLSRLHTHEDVRRCGVGRAMLRHVAFQAVQRGCFRLEVLAALDNPMSNAFYVREGLVVRNQASNRYVVQAEGLEKLAGMAGS
jgi:ribosomal protein S18 acetylase RimI-like enzyme